MARANAENGNRTVAPTAVRTRATWNQRAAPPQGVAARRSRQLTYVTEKIAVVEWPSAVPVKRADETEMALNRHWYPPNVHARRPRRMLVSVVLLSRLRAAGHPTPRAATNSITGSISIARSPRELETRLEHGCALGSNQVNPFAVSRRGWSWVLENGMGPWRLRRHSHLDAAVGFHRVSTSRGHCCTWSDYQRAWTTAPLCSVATVPLAPHSTAADRSGQLSAASCQCLAMPAGDS
jgi:hypothetical protein